jgi:prefoldin beta subunit
MQNQIPNELQNKIAQFQTLQQQLQMVAMQKQQLQMDKSEAEEASKELDSAKGDVYKSVGPLLIKTDKASLGKELKEKQSNADNRISLLEKQEQKLATKGQELQKDLQAGLSGQGGAGSS